MISQRQKARTNYQQLTAVLILLFIGFFIRSHNSGIQEAFLDEGFHVYRAEHIWEFQQNPGEISDGKFLLYYYLGLFAGKHTDALPVARTAVALFSLITAASVYMLGRVFYDHRAGLLALAIYTILPLASFYERMALADPFSAALGCILVWRSLVFARHPRWREAVVLGVLMAFTTMAKLTAIMLPLIPLVTSLLYVSSANKRWLVEWRKHYLKYLLLAWIIGVTMWLPVIVPSYFAAIAGHPFLLIDTGQVINTGGTAITYFTTLIQNIRDDTNVIFLVLAAVSIVGLFLFNKTLTAATLLFFWLAFCLLPLVSYASQPTPRYVVNAMAPLAIMIGILTSYLLTHKRVLGGIMTLALAAWAIVYALPFNAVMITNPLALPLDSTNVWFVRGAVSTSDAYRQIGALINSTPQIKYFYADWTACRLIFFYENVPDICLDRIDVAPQMNDIFRKGWGQDQDIYLIGGPFPLDTDAIRGACVSRIATVYSDENNLTAWDFHSGDCRDAVF